MNNAVNVNCENVVCVEDTSALFLSALNFFCLFSPTGYIGEFEIVDDPRSGKIVANLTGRLKKCGVISPRFDVPINDIEKWTNSLLPSRQFGYVLTMLPILATCIFWVLLALTGFLLLHSIT